MDENDQIAKAIETPLRPIKIARAFAHLPLTSLAEGITDEMLDGWSGWSPLPPHARASEESDLEPEPPPQQTITTGN
jgi:hypothetical protein